MAKKVTEPKKKETKEKTIDIKSIEIELNQYLEDRKEDITKELTTKIDEQVDIKVTKRIKEEEKKLIRGKTGKIIRRDIIIILLLALIGYFGYCLYKVDYFKIKTKIVETPKENENKNDHNNDIKEPTNNQEPVEEPKLDSSYYIKNYRNLIDNIIINDEEVYTLFNKSTTINNISNDLILKIAYKNLDKKYITNENNMLTFHEDSLLESAKTIFGNDITYKNTLFNYNNIKFMYYNETYIGLKESETKINLLYEIIDAKIEEDKLIFNIIATKLTDEGNLVDKENNIILEKYNDEDLLEYQEKLPKYQITFENINDNYIFNDIALT